jgi:hypothetical protein
LNAINSTLYSNIQQLKLTERQAYYLLGHTTNNSLLSQYLLAHQGDNVLKLLGKESVNDAVNGKPFLLPNLWLDFISSNNLQRIIVNILNNKCLEQVFSKITKESYSNSLSDMIRTFDANENVTVVIREDPDLETDTYGSCKGVLDDAGNVKFYLIRLNPNALLGASEEVIANTMFHEFIRAYLKDNLNKWDFENNSAHNQMLNNYLDKMASALNSIFGISLRDAYCLAYSGLFDDDDDIAEITSAVVRSAVRQKLVTKFNNDPTFATDDAIRIKRNDYMKNGNSGTRTNHCQ